LNLSKCTKHEQHSNDGIELNLRTENVTVWLYYT